MAKMRFGMFMSPFHVPPAGHSPTVAFTRDIQTIRLLDVLGYDECWIGEHHSGGAEIISSPELFIANVAPVTQSIKLGTGVISTPFHNPLMIVERMLLLDHLTRGRAMLGVGPGALPTDAAMFGLEAAEQQDALVQDFDVIMHLLLKDEPISVQTRRYRLVDACSQLRPFSDPIFEIAVAALSSPAAPLMAGKHGVGLLSVGATMTGGFEVLSEHWELLEGQAVAFNRTPDRSKWRLVGPMHISQTRKQALKDVEFGIEAWFDYLQHTAVSPEIQPPDSTLQERIAWVNESGLGVIGTAEDAIAQIERLWAESRGGFGCYLMLAHEWASWEATRRHYELFANEVIPHFQGSAERLKSAERRARAQNLSLSNPHTSL
jgi:limonene 1,2-monooxygenase